VDWVFVVLVGALIGWLASIVASSESQQGVTSNIIIGIAGAFVGRWLFSSVLHLFSVLSGAFLGL
jgi:uncharacterized membrane protein YeaQ/YmgE (transglycosylase-associated protein family)